MAGPKLGSGEPAETLATGVGDADGVPDPAGVAGADGADDGAGVTEAAALADATEVGMTASVGGAELASDIVGDDDGSETVLAGVETAAGDPVAGAGVAEVPEQPTRAVRVAASAANLIVVESRIG